MSSELSVKTYSDIQKKHSDVDFAETLHSFVNNLKWGNGYLARNHTSAKGYIWNCLSAIGNKIGSEVSENVINYIDNVSNIDTCHVKALQSMCKEYGIDYSILNVDNMPIEVVRLMDILSMNKTYLLEAEHSRLLDSSREKLVNDVTYKFDYYNSEFFDADYVDGDISICLSAAKSAKKDEMYANSYLLFRDMADVSCPPSIEDRINELSALGEFDPIMLSDDLSADRFSPGFYKLYADESRLKIFPTWLSDYTFEYIKLKEVSNDISNVYDLFADHSFKIYPNNVIYPEDPLSQISCIEDLYQYEGCLSTIIERADEDSDYVKLLKTYIGKSTKNHLYQVSFIPTKSKTLVDYQKYTYNEPVSFWIVMYRDKTKIICSSNSRLDSTRDNCTFYVPMVLGNEPYVYNGVRISPDEFIDDVFLSSSIYFFNLKQNIDLSWTYKLAQEPEINLYNIGVVNVQTTFYPDREVNRNSTTTVDADRYHSTLENAFFSLLSAMCNLEYLDDRLSDKEIYKNLGTSQLTLEALMNISRNDTADFIDAKNLYRVPLKFNEVVEVDKIDSGLSQLTSYSDNEQHILNMEIARRAQASNVMQNITRYYYYREAKVKEYFKYIQHLYGDKFVLSNEIYTADSSYFQVQSLSANDEAYQQMRLAYDYDNEGTKEVRINYDVMHGAASILADMALKVAEIREKLKMTSQKYYMRGTFELFAYAINEYLLNNIKVNYDELSAVSDKFADVNIIEYIDNTEYFNIKQNLEQYANIKYQEYENNRYFENTLFEELYLKTHSSFEFDKSSALSSSEISTYYNSVQKLGMSTKEKTEDFLNTVYNTGATYSHIDANLNSIAHATNIDEGVVWDNKKEALDILYKMYAGNEFGEDPVYNAKNKTFSSYQVHPFLYNFVEYVEHVFPIENYYHKYMPKDYAKRIATTIDKYIGLFGEVKYLWLTDTFDFSGYSSRFEIETNQSQTNPNNSSQFADRDGLFIDEFISTMFSSSSSVKQDSYDRAVVLDGQSDYDSSISSFLAHLKLSTFETKLIGKRFASYYQLIKDITVDNPSYYDIYKYTVDINGNVLALLKRYPKPTVEMSAQDKHNTRGTLWVRIKDHPCAFPAFNIDFGTVKKHGKLIHKITNPNNIYESLLTETNSVFYNPDPSRSLNPQILTDFGGGFYDMELDATRHYLLLSYTPSSIIGHPEVHTAKNVNIMIGKLTKDYDYTDMLYRFSYAVTDSAMIAYIDNENLREKTEDYSYSEFIGFIRYADSVGACFAQKYVNPKTQEDSLKENYHWSSNVIKVNNDFAPYTITYGIDLQIKLFAYSSELYVYHSTVSDLKYNISPDNNMCLSYADDKIILAYESKPISTNSLVTNYVEFDYNSLIDSKGALVSAYDGSISATALSGLSKHSLVNWPYVTEDFNLASTSETDSLLKNTFDSFDKYIVAIEYSFEHEDIEHIKTTYYNINSDMAYLPVFASEGGVERVWNNANLSSKAELNMQLLGYSGTYHVEGQSSESLDFQSIVSQATAKQSAALEDPFPYKATLSVEKIQPNDNNGKGIGHLPFDIYDRLDVYSQTEGLTAELCCNVPNQEPYVHFYSGVSSISQFPTAEVIFTRISEETNIGPFKIPTSLISCVSLQKTTQTEYGNRELSATGDKVYYMVNTDIDQEAFMSRLQNQKVWLYQTEISGLSNDVVVIREHSIPINDQDKLKTELAIDVPALSVKISDAATGEIKIDDGEHEAKTYESWDIVNKLLTPLSTEHVRDNVVCGYLSKQLDGTILSGDVPLTEEELSTILSTNDVLRFQAYPYANGYANGNVQMHLSSALYCKVTKFRECMLDIYNSKCYVSYDGFNSTQLLSKSIYSDIRYRVGMFVSYKNLFRTITGELYNRVSNPSAPCYNHIYENATFDQHVVNPAFYKWINNADSLVLCKNCIMKRDGGDKDYWIKISLDFTPVEAYADETRQLLVLKSEDGLMYAGNYNDVVASRIKPQLIHHESTEPLETETYVFDSTEDLSSYSLEIKNTTNNVTLWSRAVGGQPINHYQYDGDVEPDYAYNDGKIYKSSYSISHIKSLSCYEGPKSLSVEVSYADNTTSVKAGTMQLMMTSNKADTRDYDRYHVVTLKPITGTEYKRQLKSVNADTALSSVSMFANKQVAFKYSATAINTKEDYPILEADD